MNKITKENTLTIIVNVNTPEFTTLAFLSAKKHTDWPVKIIDCSNGQDKDYFLKLKNDFDFLYQELPLNIHGKTLDKIFCDTNKEYILLLDSDAELLRDDFIDKNQIADENCYGAGFLQEACRMTKDSMKGWRYLYYAERMFIPCTFLKVEPIKKAIGGGGG